MKISIITAVFNCGPYLKGCLKSVRKQDYPDYEHLLLNDQSTDNSPRILRDWAKKDKHVRIIRAKKKLHCGSAYARLADCAKGEIVGVLDADDSLAAKAMRTIVRLYENNPDIGYMWTQFWWCDSKLRKVRSGNSCHPGKLSLLEHGIRKKHNFSHWRTFRRSVIKKGNQIFREGLKSAVDKYMGYALEEIAPGAFVDAKLYKYRQRPGGLSNKGRRNWERMKRRFSRKREAEEIKPYPIKILKP